MRRTGILSDAGTQKHAALGMPVPMGRSDLLISPSGQNPLIYTPRPRRRRNRTRPSRAMYMTEGASALSGDNEAVKYTEMIRKPPPRQSTPGLSIRHATQDQFGRPRPAITSLGIYAPTSGTHMHLPHRDLSGYRPGDFYGGGGGSSVSGRDGSWRGGSEAMSRDSWSTFEHSEMGDDGDLHEAVAAGDVRLAPGTLLDFSDPGFGTNMPPRPSLMHLGMPQRSDMEMAHLREVQAAMGMILEEDRQNRPDFRPTAEWYEMVERDLERHWVDFNQILSDDRAQSKLGILGFIVGEFDKRERMMEVEATRRAVQEAEQRRQQEAAPPPSAAPPPATAPPPSSEPSLPTSAGPGAKPGVAAPPLDLRHVSGTQGGVSAATGQTPIRHDPGRQDPNRPPPVIPPGDKYFIPPGGKGKVRFEREEEEPRRAVHGPQIKSPGVKSDASGSSSASQAEPGTFIRRDPLAGVFHEEGSSRSPAAPPPSGGLYQQGLSAVSEYAPSALQYLLGPEDEPGENVPRGPSSAPAVSVLERGATEAAQGLWNYWKEGGAGSHGGPSDWHA